MFFHDLYPTSQEFEIAFNLQANRIKLQVFTDKTKRLTPIPVLYQFILAEFTNVPLRYNPQQFLNLFWTTFIEHYPSLYISQLAYIKNEYMKLEEMASRQHYMITIPTGKSISETFSAITNSGQISDSETPFSLQKESLAHKEGQKSVQSFENKKSITTNQDLYLNMMKIANNSITFGVAKFASRFRTLGQRYYTISSFENKSPNFNIEFDPDTIKKIAGKYRVVGIKDE